MQITTKLGTTRAGERTRIWIEGARLADNGFTVGKFFAREWHKQSLVLTLISAAQFDKLSRDARGTVSGKDTKPIIDVTGAKVAATFSGSHVVAVYSPGKITITNA